MNFAYGSGGARRLAQAWEDDLILSDVTLDVRSGERLGVLGPNGGGKSTLLKLTTGLLSGYSGDIEVFGRPPWQARRDGLIAIVPQRVTAELAFPLTARQVVEQGAWFGLKPWQSLTEEREDRVDRAIDLVGVAEYEGETIGELSGGQMQRVMIARALAARPSLLLLDEPMVGVDVAGQRRFASLLDSIHREYGLTLMIVSHDIRAVAAGCDRVACLSRTVHTHTSPDGLTPQVLAQVFGHDLEAVFGELHVDAHLATGRTGSGRAHEPQDQDRSGGDP